MRALLAAMVVLAAAPAFAQTQPDERIYVGGVGGFAVAPDGTSGTVMGEVGYRVAPNLFVVGNLGQFHNLQPSSIQPSIDDETLTLLNSGLTVTGTAQAPAWFTTGGVRYEIPLRKRIAPYVFTGIGFARMTPTAQFTYGSGTLLGSSPNPGDDVTPQLLALGDYIQPPSENAFMFSAGAGINAPLAPHFGLDIGYRLSHMAFDQPITAQSVTFGIGYRF